MPSFVYSKQCCERDPSVLRDVPFNACFFYYIICDFITFHLVKQSCFTDRYIGHCCAQVYLNSVHSHISPICELHKTCPKWQFTMSVQLLIVGFERCVWLLCWSKKFGPSGVWRISAFRRQFMKHWYTLAHTGTRSCSHNAQHSSQGTCLKVKWQCLFVIEKYGALFSCIVLKRLSSARHASGFLLDLIKERSQDCKEHKVIL